MYKLLLLPIITLAIGTFTVPQKPNSKKNITTYPEHLTGQFTGGFNEPTCHSCHFDYPLNFEEGELAVEGLPERYEASQSYLIRIYLSRNDLKKAGFQLTARFLDGRQAGTLSLQSDRLQFTESVPDTIQYVQHSANGTEITGENETLWTVKWIAPNSSRAVKINLSANAANGDASEFGDFILTREIEIRSSVNSDQ